MTWELVLGAALETVFGLAAQAGVVDQLGRTVERWRKVDERARQTAFEDAFAAARAAVDAPALEPLLAHAPFRAQVLAALLDPAQGLDVPQLAESWGQRLPVQAEALQSFFTALQNALLDDPQWGPPLERAQQLRHNTALQTALAQQHAELPAARDLLQRVETELQARSISSAAPQLNAQERAVVAQSIVNSIIVTGDHYTIVVPAVTPPDPEEARRREAEQRYLNRLRRRCEVLPLAALGGEAGVAEDVTLSQVYQHLDTTERTPHRQQAASDKKEDQRERDERPLTAQEAAAAHPRWVLLGNPGSGKSSFVRWLVGALAAARLGEAEPPSGWSAAPLPLLLNLREIVPALRVLTSEGISHDEQQRALCAVVFAAWKKQFEDDRAAACLPVLEGALDDGKALLIFDGLDEVPHALRRKVRQAVQAVYQAYSPQNRVIVTCRPRAYTGDARQPGFVEHTLASLDEDKIAAFTADWYTAQAALGRIERSLADARAEDFRRNALRTELRSMAQNPMLLTTMGIVHFKGTTLPRERVRLFDAALAVLLTRWQSHKGTAESERLQTILQDEALMRKILQRVAYEVHAAQAADRAQEGMTHARLQGILEGRDYLGSPVLADDFIDYVDQRAGLLVGVGGDEAGQERPALYSPHRAFQEYLAGCYMADGSRARTEYFQRAQEGDYWQQAALLGAEQLCYNNPQAGPTALLMLAQALCPAEERAGAGQWRAVLWAGQQAALLGKDALQQDDAAIGGDYLGRVRRRLVAILRAEGRGNTLTALERAEAGRALAQLGDPRIEVLDPRRIEWLLVSADDFLMGSDQTPDSIWDHEKPRHRYPLRYEYRISRYPITQAQFACFVQAGGYAHAPWWREAAQHGFWRAGQVRRRVYQPDANQFIEEWADAPFDCGAPFNLANHPVVGITWWEALAFTRWLTQELQGSPALPVGWQVWLPSEPEWEKAARGLHGQEYPWPGRFEANCANSSRTGIGATSAVGCFPGGVSPFGVEEMSGNVWEWTRSLYDTYPYPAALSDIRRREDAAAAANVRRVVRGGSFDDDENNLRCAARLRNYPDYRLYYLGFRVCAAPSPSASGAFDL